MRRDDAERTLAPYRAELGSVADTLLSQWPVRARGVQVVDLGFGVRLTLIQDDVLAALKQASFLANAWFLDGFSPAKNPEMWSQQVLDEVGRLSAAEALIGTYTVAGAVKRGLVNAGFNVEKQPGFGRKRERLEAVKSLPVEGDKPTDPYLIGDMPLRPVRTVAVIGAGIMGACLARAFSSRGANVSVFDAAENWTSGASSNPLALMMPRLDAEDNSVSRCVIDAYLSARRFYSDVRAGVWPVSALQPAKDDRDSRRFEQILSDPPLDETLLDNLAGNAVGLRHHGALALDPILIRQQLLSGLEVNWNCEVRAVQPGTPATIEFQTGKLVSADLVIVAAGAGLKDILGPNSIPMTLKAGQLECLEEETGDAPFALAAGRYIVTAGGKSVFGASFTSHDQAQPPAPREDWRQDNIKGLRALAPGLVSKFEETKLTSVTGVRATTSDRLPFAGWVPDRDAFISQMGEDLRTGRDVASVKTDIALPGIMVAGGLGARGFLWAPLLAELMVSQVFGDPAPTSLEGQRALSPARFLVRALKRGERSD